MRPYGGIIIFMLAIDANHPALSEYYTRLADLARLNITTEQSTRVAFQTLLLSFSKPSGWTLEAEGRLSSGKRPDATLKDDFGLPRGWWEAKDVHDDLEREIAAKKKIKYPLRNTIFENTQRAVLYQNEREAARFDLTKPAEVASLLTRFFNHTDEEIEEFHVAVTEFQARVPVLAEALKEIIGKAHDENANFRNAFATFHEMCRGSLNAAISQAAIEEMLVQHLLTERLFRTVFENPEFLQRNVIAREIETVINALTSQSFSRSKFLAQLDSFYKPIEKYGADISDWSEKQGFLNAIYERFFQGYSVGTADTMGIVYTPQPIVDWMCRSVDKVLCSEFGLGLSSRGVQILDPCTGTGNFIVNLIGRINRRDLAWKYEHDLFANEIMLLPYYIASMNIEHEYWTKLNEYRGFEGLCFADTLDLQEVNLFSEENTERIKRQKTANLKVIVGNPPYNMGQKNENDNNKNRAYKDLDRRIRDSYAKTSRATNKNALSDPYVKFFKWASERLDEQSGVVCFVSNNSFVDQIAFDGMRAHLQRDFDVLYHLDLHGNVRKNPKLSGTTHNVFGIQVGVGITVAVRNRARSEKAVKYFRVPEEWKRVEKEAFLLESGDVDGIAWQTLQPNSKNAWLTEGLQDDFDAFIPLGSKETKAQSTLDVEAIFKSYTNGVKTNRDDWVYDFNQTSLEEKVKRTIEAYNSEIDRWKQEGRPSDIDNFVLYDDTKLKWSRDLKADLRKMKYVTFDSTKIRRSMYRPYVMQSYYLDPILTQDIFLQHKYFPKAESEDENVVICVSGVASSKPFHCLTHNTISCLDLLEKTQCFPFYTYTENGTHRTANITDWALSQFRSKYFDSVSKRDIFHYVYALLHHPAYRAKYGANLKRELPRIPFVASSADFRAFCDIGAQLSDWHLQYESAPEYALRWVENKEVPWTWRVEKMKLSPDKSTLIVNPALTLEGIPPQALEYRLGNRSALEWIVDQYQIKTDARSGLTNDPNREDDPEYIARLVCRVVTASVETVRLVGALPELRL